MHVALIDPSLFTIPYDCALCQGLAQHDIHVDLYGRTTRPGEYASFRVIPFFYGNSEKVHKHLTGLPFKLLKGVEHYFNMRQLNRRMDEYDVVHFQWLPLPVIDQKFIAAFAKRRIPTVLTVHDITPFNNAPGSRLQKIGSASILQKFNHLIVHSKSSRDTLVERGLPANKISVIPHGILRTVKGKSLSNTRTMILMFGKIKPYKGVDVLLKAFAQLPQETQAKAQVLIVGEPAMPIAPLQEQALTLGIARHVDWDLRFVSNDEIGNIMAAADIYAFPYRDIDASGVLMSCLPYGKPVVASNIGAFASLIKDGVHGRLVPPDDPAALSAALAELIESVEKRRLYGSNVAKLAADVPSWEAIAGQTVAVYRSLINIRGVYGDAHENGSEDGSPSIEHR